MFFDRVQFLFSYCMYQWGFGRSEVSRILYYRSGAESEVFVTVKNILISAAFPNQFSAFECAIGE